MDISKIKFGDLFGPIVIGWSVGVTTLVLVSMLFVFFPAMLQDGVVNSDGEQQSPFVILIGVVLGVPIIAAFQGVLISLLCYFGICVYRKLRKL